MPKMKIAEFANSIDPDEMAHNEMPNLDLHRFPQVFESQYDTAWRKHFCFESLEIWILLTVFFFCCCCFWHFKG